MRKQAAKVFATLSLFIVLTSVSAYGQAPYQLQVNVPFDFIVGDQTFPAGDYVLEGRVFYTETLIVIRSQDNRTATTVLSMPVRVSSEQAATKLVFHRYGDRYFLAQVWRAGETVGRELLKSKLYFVALCLSATLHLYFRDPALLKERFQPIKTTKNRFSSAVANQNDS